MLDFSKLGSKTASEPIIDPREIFRTLHKKEPKKYEYARDVQAEVWKKWFEVREQRDLVLKLNTGGGKTTVGLCILQSCLNEGKGPAVYVAPNPYLVNQVVSEATALGIAVTEDENDRDFRAGEAIYVCNIHKIVNGRSVFGISERKIDVGSIIFDDAHACIHTINDQFTINIPGGTKCYESIFSLFSDSLKQQSSAKFFSLTNGDPLPSQKVPYWSWQAQLTDVYEVLAAAQKEDFIKWNYPLLSDYLKLCDCIISSRGIEISSPIIPIEVIPSITDAERKIFMTATLSDDSVLASHFGVDTSSMIEPVAPNSAGDIGERMILAPQEINVEFNETVIREICKDLSKSYNVVVIVPSSKRAELWSSYADQILHKGNIQEGLHKLNAEEPVGLTVLVNRYDGIDLPGDACRVLVVDNMPEYKSLSDRTRELELSDSSLGNRELMHRVEQGMGRGIRSNSDYCLVILMGTDLISKLYLKQAKDFFSPGTRAQLELSQNVTRDLRRQNPTVEQMREVMDACLKRNDGWVDVAKKELIGLQFEVDGQTDNVVSRLREVYDLYFRVPVEAVEKIQDLDRIGELDNNYKGYLKQVVAQYMNSFDQERAQKIQQSAIKLNKRIMKPIEGIQRRPAMREQVDQALKSHRYFADNFANGNQLIIACQEIAANMVFTEEGSDKFEGAVAEAGKFLGFDSQQPDLETATGPDVFWYLGANWGVVIECKSEASVSSISKKYFNQLNGHVTWHEHLYPMAKPPIPVMMHPASDIDDSSSIPEGAYLFNGKGLEKFRESLVAYAAALAHDNKFQQPGEIQTLQRMYNFLPDSFLKTYLSPCV